MSVRRHRLGIAWRLWAGAALHVVVWPLLLSAGLEGAQGPGAVDPVATALSLGGMLLAAGLAVAAGTRWFAAGIAGGYALLSLVSGGACTLMRGGGGELEQLVGGLVYALAVAVAGAVLVLVSLFDYTRRR